MSEAIPVGTRFLGAFPLEGAPQHLQESEHRKHVLRRFANMVAGRYGCPVYLCGSALREDNPEPRDWDIRLELPDEDFTARYGSPEQWALEGGTGDWTQVRWRWSDDCVKQTKLGWRHCELNIDLQIYPQSHCAKKYADQQRLRLDTKDGL